MKVHLQWQILRHFSTKRRFGFSSGDVVKAFPERSPAYLARLLHSMVDEGILCRIARDIYHIVPFTVDPKTYVPDGLQVAKYMILNKRYYLGYASVMKIHGLSFTPVTRVYVVTREQIKPTLRSYSGISVQFVKQSAYRFFGFSIMWINHTEKAMVSDLEKTIVDLLTRPRLGGGIFEVGKAMYRAEARINQEKLFYYFARNRSKAAKKRYIFLVEQLGLEWTAEHERMRSQLGSGISLLDPSAPDRGKRRYKYGLKINIDPACLKKEIHHKNLMNE